MIKEIETAFLSTKKVYNQGKPALDVSFSLARLCLDILSRTNSLAPYGKYAGTLDYSASQIQGRVSRPYRPDLFISLPADFDAEFDAFVTALKERTPVNSNLVTRVIYTSVMSVSMAYDIYKPDSRKTPGTYFEILIASACALAFPDYALTKHIKIEGLPVVDAPVVDALVDVVDGDDDASEFSGDSVSTDLVITNPKTGRGAVIPLKITTRERIVQPFAHQRILDSAYPGRYASFIACISETQMDKKGHTVKQICVPGTVALFQKHLARVEALYYCDVPRRYSAPDFVKVIPVRPFDTFFDDIAKHLG